MISMEHIVSDPILIERLARETYDDYRIDMLIYAGDAEMFLLPWDHPGNEHQRVAFRNYALGVCKGMKRLSDGEGPRPTPQALLEFDKKLQSLPKGCCG